MKVTILKSGSIAINPRTVITFAKGDILTCGDKGTTEANIARLVDLEFAKECDEVEIDAFDEVVEEDAVESKEDVVEEESNDDLTEEHIVEIDAFDDKDELDTFALETYDIELDKRKSLAKMKEALKLEIEKEGDE